MVFASSVPGTLDERIQSGESIVVITYGMGVYWSRSASKDIQEQVSILDLRTLNPLDWDAVTDLVHKHNKCLVITEEPLLNSFAESLAGRIGTELFESLDAPVQVVGAINLPAIPLNVALEKAMLPNPEKVREKIDFLLNY
jgi:2-oxoisovalerate dehydrogenase E1 component